MDESGANRSSGRDGNGTAAAFGRQLQELARRSDFLVSKPLVRGCPSGDCRIDRFIFEGPHGGGDPIRIGLFGAIHGDEKAGAAAIARLAEYLVRNPGLAEGYHLYLYPICNPQGYDADTRHSPTGKDLNREFWRESSEPEVRMLEREILDHSFHGLVSLHADDTSDGVYGFVRGAVLTRSLLEPALRTAEQVLARNRNPVIDGFPAENGIISQCYDGILTSPPRLQNTPFEIILETPHHAAMEKQVEALFQACLTILAEYRKFIAFAAGL